jgi:hypothetical protein
MDPKVRILPRCYNEAGEWIATSNDIIRWFDEFGVAWRPKATRKHPLKPEELEVLRNYPNIFEENKKEEQIREKLRISKSFNGRQIDAGQGRAHDSTIFERDSDILKNIPLNDIRRVERVSPIEADQIRHISTASFNAEKVNNHRKKQRVTESPSQLQRHEAKRSNEGLEETPIRKRKGISSHSTVLIYEDNSS